MQRGRPKRDTGDLTYSQWYNRNVRKNIPRPTRRKDPNAKCEFCHVFLAGAFGTKTGRKYCDGCRNSPRLRKYLNAYWCRKSYNKIRGNRVDTQAYVV